MEEIFRLDHLPYINTYANNTRRIQIDVTSGHRKSLEEESLDSLSKLSKS